MKGVAVATDIDDGSKSAYDLPDASKAGAIEVPKDKDGKPLANGGPDDDETARMGASTGWAPRFGWPLESAHESESLLDHSTWLEGQLSDKLYGGKCFPLPPP